MSTDLAIVRRDPVLARLSAARATLCKAQSIQAVKVIADLASAANVYARQQKLGDEAIGFAYAVRVEAQRRLGELWHHAPKNVGAKGNKGGRGNRDVRIRSGTAQPPTAHELGLTKKEIGAARALAALPSTKFAQVRDRAVTLAEARRQLRPAARAAKLAATAWPPGRYGVILADPPWRPDAGVLDPTRAIENQYPTMTGDELAALRPRLDALALDDCVLLLWATTQKLREAIALLDAWAFTVKSGAVWIKPSIGMGYWFRGRHELLILATRGNPATPLDADRPDSVITAPRRGHSEKPDEVYRAIEIMFPVVPKVELFARAHRDGWAHATNETELRSA